LKTARQEKISREFQARLLGCRLPRDYTPTSYPQLLRGTYLKYLGAEISHQRFFRDLVSHNPNIVNFIKVYPELTKYVYKYRNGELLLFIVPRKGAED
jgi:hypothetical protein